MKIVRGDVDPYQLCVVSQARLKLYWNEKKSFFCVTTKILVMVLMLLWDIAKISVVESFWFWRAIKIVLNVLNILLWCILCWHVNCMLSKINGSLLFMPKIWHHNTERSFTSVRLIKIKHSLAELDSENHSRWKHFWKSMNKTENTISYFADLGKHFGTDFKFMWKKNIFFSTSSSQTEESYINTSLIVLEDCNCRVRRQDGIG